MASECFEERSPSQNAHFGNFDFEIWVEGWFWVHAHKVTHVKPRSKNGAKHQNLNQKITELCPLMFMLKSGIWPILDLELAICFSRHLHKEGEGGYQPIYFRKF